ncbi:hypothetical protein LRY64_05490 [Candidatus Woesebacteria bacterium]|nr:hypothetical protein [Candidatus Woesebacteria bacterium]
MPQGNEPLRNSNEVTERIDFSEKIAQAYDELADLTRSFKNVSDFLNFIAQWDFDSQVDQRKRQQYIEGLRTIYDEYSDLRILDLASIQETAERNKARDVRAALLFTETYQQYTQIREKIDGEPFIASSRAEKYLGLSVNTLQQKFGLKRLPNDVKNFIYESYLSDIVKSLQEHAEYSATAFQLLRDAYPVVKRASEILNYETYDSDYSQAVLPLKQDTEVLTTSWVAGVRAVEANEFPSLKPVEQELVRLGFEHAPLEETVQKIVNNIALVCEYDYDKRQKFLFVLRRVSESQETSFSGALIERIGNAIKKLEASVTILPDTVSSYSDLRNFLQVTSSENLVDALNRYLREKGFQLQPVVIASLLRRMESIVTSYLEEATDLTSTQKLELDQELVRIKLVLVTIQSVKQEDDPR